MHPNRTDILRQISSGRHLARAAALAALSIAGWLGGGHPAGAAEPLAIAEGADGQPISLPSVAAELDSFDAVAGALTEDRKRVAALEDRLRRLEEKGAPETLPAPSTKENAAAKQPDVPKPDTAKKVEKKPAEPYEIGSDKALKDTWKDGFQAESANKDFRIKIGGRTQV
ncbi:MAG: hypothetical protein EBZ59_12290, partial [Planctomycetia bacterium]|nr:hypothetical protein [Planctomycetia bacterium]